MLQCIESPHKRRCCLTCRSHFRRADSAIFFRGWKTDPVAEQSLQLPAGPSSSWHLAVGWYHYRPVGKSPSPAFQNFRGL